MQMSGEFKPILITDDMIGEFPYNVAKWQALESMQLAVPCQMLKYVYNKYKSYAYQREDSTI